MYMHYNCNTITIKEAVIMASVIQVRVDDDLKTRSDILFKSLGTDTTTAIRIFLTQALAANGFPFEIRRNADIYRPLTESEILEKLAISRTHAEQGLYRDADDVLADVRSKYGI